MPNPEFENGVNGATGEYLFPKAGSKEIADIAKTTAIKTFHLFDLQDRNRELKIIYFLLSSFLFLQFKFKTAEISAVFFIYTIK